MKSGLAEQNSGARFRNDSALDFDGDLSRDGCGVNALVWVLDAAKDGAVLEPGV